ncbi:MULTISPECIES: ribosome small subunit-dependent GTPase A [Bacillus]|uniref:Small ribosomal subunit biogenesis GTPase RsgA n=1 Tax=Bacillus paralicheniformis TaxID=1648923 RepID=A0A7Z0WUQ2_9BACI|nr:ribosome small subunit-dependent GTPase A [Bacillus paralicheniformis]MBL7475241.1 ribosome small subunit-dependent GTPase A [Bacillus paralicheniformis]MBU8582544.1 ribosome small subunit-dependent GTPase A [Bacillus paralicheniformis]MCY8037218.1 ribosome small subunit-dependent GTPase A [Bacillus paralicheniformis]MCY8181651.1 ribosome small subunit-dependent GTPase A [Bacillus paralicheniformis]MED1126380.1 ribosome small subunit-dependent GTPase A [Bacillus paralicheniformis]
MPEGKIIKALSGFYYVLDGDQIIQCRGRGVFRKNKITPLVGDDVVYQADNDKEGYILEIKDRFNELVRPPISNVDQAVLVFSAKEPTFSTSLLDRFLVLVEAGGIRPIICITKMDLVDDDALKERIHQYAEDYRNIGYSVYTTSMKNGSGIEDIVSHFQDKITVFAGQSGVGKSSLLNAISPDLELKTAGISAHLGRGKHTTRHVELIDINGGLVADTPGFSSLEFAGIEAEDLGSAFLEISEKSAECKFRGCLHMKEPNCAVKRAVENGEIAQYRYDHYVEFLTEIKDRKPRY